MLWIFLQVPLQGNTNKYKVCFLGTRNVFVIHYAPNYILFIQNASQEEAEIWQNLSDSFQKLIRWYHPQ